MHKMLFVCSMIFTLFWAATEPVRSAEIVKEVIRGAGESENLLHSDQWLAYGKGYVMEGEDFVCTNPVADGPQTSGARQTVILNQVEPAPIIAEVSSAAEGVDGGQDSNYSLYLDLQYQDGTPLWGQVATFATGSHDWQKGKVVIFPEKPVRSVSVYLLFRGHTGEVRFRDPLLMAPALPSEAGYFDGIPVRGVATEFSGFQIRDVAADGDFCIARDGALDMGFEVDETVQGGARWFNVEMNEQSGRDRAITLSYSMPLPAGQWTWWAGPREALLTEASREYRNGTSISAGAIPQMSTYPLGVVTSGDRGFVIAMDMASPAVFRIGLSGALREFYISFDLGFTSEHPQADARFCLFEFNSPWGFRAALVRYYDLFPEHFRGHADDHGTWMPFARISDVANWRDFGFQFKEGTNETGWDDQNGITTFRYTEPLTWWMDMESGMDRTMAAGVQYAEQLLQKGDQRAAAWKTSVMHDRGGQPTGKALDTPWCDGIVWSMNSSPAVQGEVTDYSLKWNDATRGAYSDRDRFGPQTGLDGEYIDSSEGYVTAELDFRRSHFAGAIRPLTFSFGDWKPALFRGLIAWEYVRGISIDVHRNQGLMMANSTPDRLCWLAPWLDVMGSETDWNPGGEWRPMSDARLMFRRVMCAGKPYCFLMNTDFNSFPKELTERYMKRAVAYGFFPGFFSHNAAEGHYFSQPALYERDRPLFKKYVPLCKRLSEAGWEPVTKARSTDEEIILERFGTGLFTVYNPTGEAVRTEIRFDDRYTECTDLLTGRRYRQGAEGSIGLNLESEALLVLEGRKSTMVSAW
jgi:hypothetical protein